MIVEVILYREIPKDCIVVEAFPSKGYVSTLAANQLIKQLDMDLVGSVRCSKLESIAVVHEKKPMYPVRIYAKDNLVIVFSEIIIPFSLTHDFSQAIGSWMQSINPKSVIFLASIPGVESQEEHEILTITTDKKFEGILKGLNIKQMDEGVLTGLSSALMLSCIENKIPATSIMVETSYAPDVLASASLLEIIGKILDIEVDLTELMDAGDKVESKFKESINQMKKGHENLKQMHEDTMYR
jgi:uncharacterized protein